MEIKELMQELSAFKEVGNVSMIRDNVVKLDIDKNSSKEFFTKLRDVFGFEHCSLITAIDNQPEFELVYHFTAVNKSVIVSPSTLTFSVQRPWVIGCCGPILIHISAITTPPRVFHTRNPSSMDDLQNLLGAIHGANQDARQSKFPSDQKLLSHAN